MKISTVLVAALVAAATLVAGTPASAVPYTMPAPPPKPIRSMKAMSVSSTGTPTGVVVTSPPQLLIPGTGHDAFPSYVSFGTEGAMAFFRRAGGHEVRDGRIATVELDAFGQNPGPVQTMTLVDDDTRDPSASFIDGGMFLTFFTGETGAPATGAYVALPSGQIVRIDPGFGRAAISAPIVKLPNGDLGAAWYGNPVNGGQDDAYMSISKDGGLTWGAPNRILNPATEGTPEPWLVVDGGKLLMFARWGWDALAVRISTNSGAAGSWNNPKKISETVKMTGRPTTYLTPDGVQILTYRTLPAKDAQIAFSLDHGVTWKIGPILMKAPPGSPNGMTYTAAGPVPGMPGVTRMLVGMEAPGVNGAPETSAIYATYVATSAAIS